MLFSDLTYQAQIQGRYGAPFWGVYRVDLQRALAARAEELGVRIELGARVSDVDFSTSTVVLDSGARVLGDIVLAADGLWSHTRSLFLDTPSPALPTGDLAYRIILRIGDLDPNVPEDQELIFWIKKPAINFWIGPRGHVVGYTVRGTSLYNLVCLAPDDSLPPECVKQDVGDIGELRRYFEGWDPLLRRFLDKVESVAKWKLMWLDQLPSWGTEDGRFVMAGDACHPMLPYLAQGANSSLEDGAVLGCLLGKVHEPNQLDAMSRMYQNLRKKRGEAIARETFRQREDFHMEDGVEQVRRDEHISTFRDGGLAPDNPIRWSCSRVQPWIFAYDSYKEALQAYEENPF